MGTQIENLQKLTVGKVKEILNQYPEDSAVLFIKKSDFSEKNIVSGLSLEVYCTGVHSVLVFDYECKELLKEKFKEYIEK